MNQSETMQKKDPGERRGRDTWEEICSQPEVWSDAIDELKRQAAEILNLARRGKYEQVIFTGCGSTYYLSLAAAAIFQEQTGCTARGIPASELWLSPKSSYVKDSRALLIAVSRSGETSETIQACERFREDQRGDIITLVCNPHSPLTNMGSLNLVFPTAMEKSVAQTRAFSTLYLAATCISAVWGGSSDVFDRLSSLPASGKLLIDTYEPVAAQYGKNLDLDRIYFLGSGERYGLACELCLKMKEMTLTHSEAFHFLEFRHGPKAMVNQKTLVVGLLSEANASRESAVLADVLDLGGNSISVGEKDTDVKFESGIKEVYRNVLYLPFGQMMAFKRSVAKGLDPDHPTNLDAVVKLTS